MESERLHLVDASIACLKTLISYHQERVTRRSASGFGNTWGHYCKHLLRPLEAMDKGDRPIAPYYALSNLFEDLKKLCSLYKKAVDENNLKSKDEVFRAVLIRQIHVFCVHRYQSYACNQPFYRQIDKFAPLVVDTLQAGIQLQATAHDLESEVSFFCAKVRGSFPVSHRSKAGDAYDTFYDYYKYNVENMETRLTELMNTLVVAVQEAGTIKLPPSLIETITKTPKKAKPSQHNVHTTQEVKERLKKLNETARLVAKKSASRRKRPFYNWVRKVAEKELKTTVEDMRDEEVAPYLLETLYSKARVSPKKKGRTFHEIINHEINEDSTLKLMATSQTFFLSDKPATMSLLEYSFFLDAKNALRQSNDILRDQMLIVQKYVHQVSEIGYTSEDVIISLTKSSFFCTWIKNHLADESLLIFTQKKWLISPPRALIEVIDDDQLALSDIARRMLAVSAMITLQKKTGNTAHDEHVKLVVNGPQPCCFYRDVDYPDDRRLPPKPITSHLLQPTKAPTKEKAEPMIIIADLDLFNVQKHVFCTDWEVDPLCGMVAQTVKELLAKCSSRPFTPSTTDTNTTVVMPWSWHDYAVNVLPKKLRVIAKYTLHLVDSDTDEKAAFRTKYELFNALIGVCQVQDSEFHVDVQGCIEGHVFALHTLVEALKNLPPTFAPSKRYHLPAHNTKDKLSFLARRMWPQFERVLTLKRKKGNVDFDEYDFHVAMMNCLRKFCRQQELNAHHLACLADGSCATTTTPQRDTVDFQRLKTVISRFPPPLSPYKPRKIVQILGLNTAKGRFARRIQQLNYMDKCVKLVKDEPFAVHVAMKMLLDMDFIPIYYHGRGHQDEQDEYVERQVKQHKRLVQEMMTICRHTPQAVREEREMTLQVKRSKQAEYVKQLQMDAATKAVMTGSK